MTIVTRRPQATEARRYGGSADEAVGLINWILEKGGSAGYFCDSAVECTHDMHQIRIRSAGRTWSAQAGDWIVYEGREFRPYRDEEYRLRFTDTRFRVPTSWGVTIAVLTGSVAGALLFGWLT